MPINTGSAPSTAGWVQSFCPSWTEVLVAHTSGQQAPFPETSDFYNNYPWDGPLHPVCGLEHGSSSPAPPNPIELGTDPSTFWDSGDIVNANGNAFSLYLLPAVAVDDLTNDVYRDLCNDVGLQPITPLANGCMLPDERADERASPSVVECEHTNRWFAQSWSHGVVEGLWMVHEATQWDNIVVRAYDTGQHSLDYFWAYCSRPDSSGASPAVLCPGPLQPVCALEHTALTPPTPAGGDATTFWDSGTVTNTNGNSFSLYLLPAQPPHAFEDSAAGTRAYLDLCAQAGLKGVVSGSSNALASVDCTQIDCMRVTATSSWACDFAFGRHGPGWDEGVALSDDTLRYHSASASGCGGYCSSDDWGGRPYLGNGLRYGPERWDLPLHPICGLEHDGLAPSPPGGEGNGGKGR